MPHIQPKSSNSSAANMQLIQKPSAVDIADSRKRQTRRDEAIRRKIESDFSKKRKQMASRHSSKPARRKAAPGTVSTLRPNEPILVKTTTTALEAARLMGAKRENCLLVVDESNTLVGIFTAKDLAYRVVASGKVAAFVKVDQIMTKNPVCVSEDTAASETLNLMVQRGFRHLPILDTNGSIFGVLDITKCYQEAMEKLERMYDSSKKLYDALDNVNQEIGISQQPFQVVKYFENLQELMGGPVLDSVLDSSTLPAYINVKSSVLEAAITMKEHKTTALLVKDSSNEEVSGIFTSKDVVLRVIAAGLDPKTCSVVRVMTPQPDCAPKTLTIHAALRKMLNGHYMNLPVVENNEIIGIVEVLKLTHATLKQLKAVKSNDDQDPIWNRFWTALDDDSLSGSHRNDSFSQGSLVSQSSHQTTPDDLPLDNLQLADLHPNDSISCADEPLITESFGFKFRSPSGRVHRISMRPSDGLSKLRSLIVGKLGSSELLSITSSEQYGADFEFSDDDSEVGEQSHFAISYLDDEGDLVAITTDQDLADCVALSRQLQMSKADIFVHDPSKSAMAPPSDPTMRNAHNNSEHHQKSSVYKPVEEDFIPGVPNQLLLPGAIMTLAVSIMIVFSFRGRH